MLQGASLRRRGAAAPKLARAESHARTGRFFFVRRFAGALAAERQQLEAERAQLAAARFELSEDRRALELERAAVVSAATAQMVALDTASVRRAGGTVDVEAAAAQANQDVARLRELLSGPGSAARAKLPLFESIAMQHRTPSSSARPEAPQLLRASVAALESERAGRLASLAGQTERLNLALASASAASTPPMSGRTRMWGGSASEESEPHVEARLLHGRMLRTPPHLVSAAASAISRGWVPMSASTPSPRTSSNSYPPTPVGYTPSPARAASLYS